MKAVEQFHEQLMRRAPELRTLFLRALTESNESAIHNYKLRRDDKRSTIPEISNVSDDENLLEPSKQ